jgi:hypothetical protein
MHSNHTAAMKMDRYNRFQYRKAYNKRFVDPFKGRDHQCLVLGIMGFYSRYIAKETGLSEGQVNYRLRKYGIHRSDIRGGNSIFAKTMLNIASDGMEARLTRFLKDSL